MKSEILSQANSPLLKNTFSGVNMSSVEKTSMRFYITDQLSEGKAADNFRTIKSVDRIWEYLLLPSPKP